MLGFILKIVRSVVNHVISDITSKVNRIQDEVTSPLNAIVREVTGGAWKGDGAQRFVSEMSSEVIPDLVNIANVNMGFGGAIKKALDLLDQAERQATSKANELVDVFGKIFS